MTDKNAEAPQSTAAQEAVADTRGVIEVLLTLTHAAQNVADSADGGDGIEDVTVDRHDFSQLSDALDALDELPDDQPGYTMEPAAKARWALRGLLDAPVAAAPVEQSPTKPLGCDVCPVTSLPFYDNMEHPERGMIAMYGGPFDVYSIPELGDDDELRRERFDLGPSCRRWNASHRRRLSSKTSRPS